VALISRGQILPPQSLADTSMSPGHSYWYSSDGMPLVDRWATYSAVYRAQPVLSGVLDKIAKLTARLSLVTWDISDPEAKTQDRDSDYSKLLRRPCAYMDTFSFWVWWATTYEIYGEVYALKIRDDDGQVRSLAPMHPTRTMIERDKDGEELFKFYMGSGDTTGILEVGRSEVILMRRYNPDTPMRGLSQLESLTRTIQNEDAVRTSVSATWQRGSQPLTALKVTSNITQDKMDKFQAKIEQRHAGPSKSGGLLLLPQGIEPVELQIDPQKMQLIESLKLTREEVLIRIDFPPPAAHILDHATFANITEQMRSMYRDSMAPRLEAIESVLEFDLRPEFFADDQRLAKFDLDEVLRGDFEVRAQATTNMVQNGIASPNEARVMFGMARSTEPEADKLYANQALQPLGTPVAGSEPVAVPEDDTTDVVPVESNEEETAQRRSISGRLGRKVGKDTDRDGRLEAYRDEILKVVDETIQSQKAAVLALIGTKALRFEVGEYDSPLSKSLVSVLGSVAVSAGRAIDKKYTVGDELDLEGQAHDAAHGINSTTMTAINKALEEGAGAEDIEHAFDVRLSVLKMTAMALAHRISSQGELDSATRYKKATKKTWNTGSNPRPSHAKLDGESVGIRDRFSNGDEWPGQGGSEDTGCNCSLTYS
jgi:HK97 family phage portal protein